MTDSRTMTTENDLLKALRNRFGEVGLAALSSQHAGATLADLAVLVAFCDARSLDPMMGHVYLDRRWDERAGREQVRPAATIDAFRAIAEASGVYTGQRGPEWCGSDGGWRGVWTEADPPVAARVGVLRKDFAEPLWGTAHLSEYLQRRKDGQPGPTWRKLPRAMIAKCAEAVALRRAFPTKLAGLYTPDEMAQARTAPDETVPRGRAAAALPAAAASVVGLAVPVVERRERATVAAPTSTIEADGAVAALPSSSADGQPASTSQAATAPDPAALLAFQHKLLADSWRERIRLITVRPHLENWIAKHARELATLPPAVKPTINSALTRRASALGVSRPEKNRLVYAALAGGPTTVPPPDPFARAAAGASVLSADAGERQQPPAATETPTPTRSGSDSVESGCGVDPGDHPGHVDEPDPWGIA